MKRRDLLKGSLGVGAGFALRGALGGSLAPAGSAPRSLKALAAGCGVKLGAQAQKRDLQTPEFVRFVTDNFSVLTPGNELKWPRLQPSPGVFNFDDADWMVNFCEAHGLAVHGHNLCWNTPRGNPAWFDGTLTKENGARFLTDHITTVMKHYRGRIESWDVVNEPIVSWSNRPGLLYPGIWLNVIGANYIDVAFHAAQQADPGALRVLNCYSVEQDTPDTPKTREMTLALLQQLLKRGVPVQAVGLESHINASSPRGGPAYVKFIEQVRGMGLQVLITELDVDDSRVPGDTAARDEVVGQYYYDYLTEVVPAGKVNRVIFWAPSDRWNWLDALTSPKFRRDDGSPHRLGLVDTNLQLKASYDAVGAALQKLGDARSAPTRWSAKG